MRGIASRILETTGWRTWHVFLSGNPGYFVHCSSSKSFWISTRRKAALLSLEKNYQRLGNCSHLTSNVPEMGEATTQTPYKKEWNV